MLSFLRRAVQGLRRKREREEVRPDEMPAPIEEVDAEKREKKRRRRLQEQEEDKKEAMKGHYDQRKRRFVKKKRSPLASLRKKQAILATSMTSGTGSGKALGELVELIEDALDDLYPVPEAESLEKAKARPQRYNAIDLETAGVLYISFKDTSIDAVAVCKHACARCERSRRLARLIPFTDVCYASEEDVLATVQPLLDRLEGRSYAVEVKRRNNETFPKDDVIRSVARAIPRPWKVDLKEPDCTILVHVFQSIAGCAVVPGYHDLKDMNLPKLKKAKAAAAAEAAARGQAQGEQGEQGDVDEIL